MDIRALVSSVGGRLAVAGNTPYHAAKWAVGGFSVALAMEIEWPSGHDSQTKNSE